MLLLTVAHARRSRSACTSSCPKGLFPQQDTGLLTGFSEAPQDISFPAMQARAGDASTRSSRPIPTSTTSSRSSAAAQRRAATPARCSSRSSRTPSARRPPTRSSRRLRPKLAQVAGHQRCSCSRCRTCASAAASSRTQYQYTLQDADLDELRRWAPQGAASAAQAARAAGRRHRSADRRARSSTSTIDRDTAARLGHHAADDRRHALRRLRPAPGRDARSPQLNQYRVVLEATPELSRRAPTQLDARLRARRRAARWCRCRASRTLPHRADAAVDQPPGPVPADDAVVQPGARRRARPGRRRPSTRAERADRPAGERARRASRARRRRSAPRSAASRC